MLQARGISLISLCLILPAIIDGLSNCVATCKKSYTCLSTEAVVFATDGQSCHVFRNPCEFNKKNCQRINNCLKELKRVTKQSCQKMCNTVCPAIYSPVCASYNNKKQTFSSQCVLNSHKCSTGQSWVLTSNSECSNTARNGVSTMFS